MAYCAGVPMGCDHYPMHLSTSETSAVPSWTMPGIPFDSVDSNAIIMQIAQHTNIHIYIRSPPICMRRGDLITPARPHTTTAFRRARTKRKTRLLHSFQISVSIQEDTTYNRAQTERQTSRTQRGRLPVLKEAQFPSSKLTS